MQIVCTSLPPPAGRYAELNENENLAATPYFDREIDYFYTIAVGQVYQPLGMLIDNSSECQFLLPYFYEGSKIAKSISLISKKYFSIRNNAVKSNWVYWHLESGKSTHLLCPAEWGEPIAFLKSLNDSDVEAIRLINS